MWFIQLNVIPGLAGHASLIFIPFFVFYLALSIQVDIEDIAEDAGKIKTLASLLGKETAGYLVIFLLTLFAFLIGLPWVWIMLALIVLQREFNLPKRSYDALLLLLGLYFLLR
jgi:4-hydroxybenzoate polyprenyltransferase